MHTCGYNAVWILNVYAISMLTIQVSMLTDTEHGRWLRERGGDRKTDRDRKESSVQLWSHDTGRQSVYVLLVLQDLTCLSR